LSVQKIYGLLFIPLLENCLMGGWWCVCVDRSELQQCYKTNVFKFLYFVFCVPLCPHCFWNMVVLILYDSQTSEAALGFLGLVQPPPLPYLSSSPWCGLTCSNLSCVFCLCLTVLVVYNVDSVSVDVCVCIYL